MHDRQQDTIDEKEELISEDDPNRVELMWSPTQEELCYSWGSIATKRSKQHLILAKWNKFLFRIFSLLAIIIPTVLTGVTQMYAPPMLIAAGFIVTGIINGISSLFDFGGTYQKHNEYNAKYEDYARDIHTELNKPKAFRQACDVFVSRIEMTLNAFTKQAPDL